MTVSYERRLHMADRLRDLREAVGLRANELAARLDWDPAKVSRIQRGHQLPTTAEARAWCAATLPNAAEEIIAELTAIRAEAARWTHELRTGHRAIQEARAADETGATRIRALDLTLVTGLLQTADYARVVFQQHAKLHGTTPDTDAAVAARMQRQHVLYDSTKQIDLLMTEAALRAPIGTPEIRAAQLDRIRAVAGSVKIGVIPQDTDPGIVPMHGWWIYDNLVEFEVMHTTITSNDPEDLELYNHALDQLWTAAVTGAELRQLLDTLI
ncbi:helix-turn-helix domain-containing protein [Sciscionella sediminilitoris]|uniref:helix-turn-helix domain-containing protein n=1 Tax=Sciscionella sediminilitoris TaxID=1445613 RepID=UPI0007C68F0B|nr:helix-turn-helix transcriptional regulator [Sciscionella sp. SE31]